MKIYNEIGFMIELNVHPKINSFFLQMSKSLWWSSVFLGVHILLHGASCDTTSSPCVVNASIGVHDCSSVSGDDVTSTTRGNSSDKTTSDGPNKGEELLPHIETPRYTTITVTGLSVFGIAGNILTLGVVRQLKRNSFNTYIEVVAIADFVHCISDLVVMYALDFGDVDAAFSLCTVADLPIFWSGEFSSWLLVAATIDRFIGIQLPLKAAMLCTRKRTIIVSSVIALLLAIINGLPVVMYYIDPLDDVIFSWPMKLSQYCGGDILYTHMSLYFALPTLIIIVFNCFIVRKLKLFSHEKKKLTGGASKSPTDKKRPNELQTSEKSSSQNYTHDATTDTSLPAGTTHVSHISGALTTETKQMTAPVYKTKVKVQNADKTVRRTVLILLSITSFQILCNIPLMIAQFCDLDPSCLTWIGSIQSAIYISNSLSHTANFVLYCMSGTMFRNAFLSMISVLFSRIRHCTQ